MDASDLSMVDSRLGRLLLQGTVAGKCYRLVVERLAGEHWLLASVTGYRYSAGDPRKGQK